MKNTSKIQAFSLVELSIVLIIIGLLTSGIVAGKSLIEQAKLNSTIRDFGSFETSYNNFKNQYSQAPGDLDSASLYWASGCVTSGDPEDCDGDGNGIILSYTIESGLAWKHLALAKMLDSGITDITPDDFLVDSTGMVPGTNAPESAISGAGYMIANGEVASLWDKSINSVYLGKPYNTYLTHSVFTPEVAYSIDKKIDDGSIDNNSNAIGAGTGTLRVADGDDASGGCVSSASGITAYNLETSQVSCIIGKQLSIG